MPETRPPGQSWSLLTFDLSCHIILQEDENKNKPFKHIFISNLSF